MVGALALTFDQHVSFADGVGLGVNFLTVEECSDLLIALRGNRHERFFRHGKHAAGAAGAVIQQIGAGFKRSLDRQENEVRHQPNGIARRPVLACLLVVVLVELANQLLKNRAHRVVVDARRRQVNFGIKELVDQRAERVGLGECGELVAELEVLQYVLDVGREAVEIVLEIGEQLLLTAARFQIAQGEARGVVEGLPRSSGKRSALLGDVRLVEHLLGVEHRLFGRFEHRIHAPNDEHGQDYIGVLTPLEQVAKHIVGDTPDERDNFVMRCLVHILFTSYCNA